MYKRAELSYARNSFGSETRLKAVLYTLQDKITLLNEIVREGGRSSRLARGGFATVDFNVEKKEKIIMDGDSGQIEFERAGVNCPRFYTT